MSLFCCKTLSTTHKIAVRRLWNNEYPSQLGFGTEASLEHYLEGLEAPEHFLWLDDQRRVSGWAFRFTRDGQCWFAIILDRAIQGGGLGSFLLNRLKQQTAELHGWVVDHSNYLRADAMPYPSPLNFYLKAGFSVQAGCRLETPVLSAVKVVWKAE